MNYNYVSGKKKLFFGSFKKYKADYFMTNFPQRNRTEWIKIIDNKIKINPVLLCEYFFSFRKRDKNSIELEVDWQRLFQPHEIGVHFT